MTTPFGSHVGQHPYRLGRKRPLADSRTLRLAHYLDPTLKPPPASFDATEGITAWGMMGNDTYGDCTCAAAGHMEMVWSKAAGVPLTFTDAEILDLYSRVDGGHDDGAVELFVLREWRNRGLQAGSNYAKLRAYCEVDPKDLKLAKQAISLFYGVYLGISLPVTAQDQAVWDDTGNNDPASQPGSWGGHAVPVVAYTPDQPTVVTWGKLQPMTWRFWARYVDECWAAIPQNYTGGGIDFSKLDSDIAHVGRINP